MTQGNQQEAPWPLEGGVVVGSTKGKLGQKSEQWGGKIRGAAKKVERRSGQRHREKPPRGCHERGGLERSNKRRRPKGNVLGKKIRTHGCFCGVRTTDCGGKISEVKKSRIWRKTQKSRERGGGKGVVFRRGEDTANKKKTLAKEVSRNVKGETGQAAKKGWAKGVSSNLGGALGWGEGYKKAKGRCHYARKSVQKGKGKVRNSMRDRFEGEGRETERKPDSTKKGLV